MIQIILLEHMLIRATLVVIRLLGSDSLLYKKYWFSHDIYSDI